MSNPLWLIFNVHIKASLVIGIGLLVWYGLRRGSATYRDGLLKCVCLVLCVLPVLVGIVPSIQFEVPRTFWPGFETQQAFSENPSAEALDSNSPTAGERRNTFSRYFPQSNLSINSDSETPTSSEGRWDLGSILLIIYGLGTGWFLIVTVIRFLLIQRQVYRYSHCLDPQILHLVDSCKNELGIERRVLVRIGPNHYSPFVWGLNTACIVIPPALLTFSRATQRDILLHELSHVRRSDFMFGLASRILVALYWVNPLVWLFIARQRQESEKTCDEMVLAVTEAPSHYASSLVSIARGLSQPHSNALVLAPGAVSHTNFTSRIQSILSYQQRSTAMSRYQIALTVLVLSSISVVSIALDGERQENTPFNVSSTDAPKFAVLERTAPTYPKAAIDNKVEGYAVVEFDITTSGTVAKPRVVESKPSQIFDQAAIDAVAHWLYLPEYNNGKAMPTTGVRTRLSFSLKDKPGYDSDTDLIQVISIGNEQGGKPWVYLVGDSITSAQVEAAFNDLKLDKLPASELKQILATIEEQAARTSSGDLYIALARAYESQNNWAQVQRALALGFEKGELNNGKAARFLAARTLFHTSRYDEAEQILNSLSLDYPNDHDISNWQKVVNREASRRNLVAQHLLESAIR